MTARRSVARKVAGMMPQCRIVAARVYDATRRCAACRGRHMKWLHLWVALATLASVANAAAEVYPSRTIKIVVPLPPGATADTLPRIIADKLTRKWAQPVIIENRPGAAQNLGAEVVAKAEPDKLSYASPGAGSPPHLAAAMLAAAAGVRIVHVPYQGLAPAMTDLLAGHVDMMFDNLGNTLPHIKEGRLRVLATSSPKRIPEFPDVPAVAEIYPDVVYTSWFAIVAPPKTPPEIAGQLSSAIAEVLRMPDVVNRLQAMSARPGGQSPAETARLFAEERERWRKVIASTGIKAQ